MLTGILKQSNGKIHKEDTGPGDQGGVRGDTVRDKVAREGRRESITGGYQINKGHQVQAAEDTHNHEGV